MRTRRRAKRHAVVSGTKRRAAAKIPVAISRQINTTRLLERLETVGVTPRHIEGDVGPGSGPPVALILKAS